MKFLLLVVALAMAGTQSTPETRVQAAGGTVEGTVRRSDTKAPVADVNVYMNEARDLIAAGAEYPKPIEARSDGTGRFVFNDVPPGKYFLHIESQNGYFWTDAGRYIGGLPVTVAAHQRVDDIALSVAPGSSISGRVLGPDGEPVAGAWVHAATTMYRDGSMNLETRSQVTTNHRGEYRLFRLYPGKYYVRTEYHPSTDPYPPMVYFPGTLDETLAIPVVTSPGGESTGIDFSLVSPPQVPGFTISGRVTGLPLSIAEKPVEALRLIPRDSKAANKDMRFANTASDRSDGRFEIRGVRPGVYDLWAGVPDGGGFFYTARTTLDVAASKVENVTINVTAGVDLQGRILLNGRPPEGQNGTQWPPGLEPRGEAPAGFFNSSPNAVRMDRDTGEFTIRRIPPGRYTVGYVPVLPDAYVADIRQGGLSVLDGLTIGSDTPSPIDILVSSPGGVLDGQVFGVDLNPSPGARVVLVSQSYPGREYRWYADVTADKDGHFMRPGIPPGEYRIYAWMNVPSGAWQNAAFMRRYELLGQPVSFSAGKTTAVRVTVISDEPWISVDGLR